VRKIFSLVCLALILLNVMGYYGVLMGLQSRHSSELTQEFDADIYDHSRALAIKIPAKASQEYQSGKFQRIDGKFEKSGNIYRLIKQRVYMDTFHIIYIKDIRGTAINLALKDYAKSFSDQQPVDDGQQPFIVPLFMKEYWVSCFILEQNQHGWTYDVLQQSPPTAFIPSYSPSIVHPPERLV
jgi:hypothetical protein